MANETFILQTLKKAKDEKLLDGKQRPLILETVNSGNQIISILKKEEELSIEQLAHRLKINKNTAKIYLRVLEKIGVADSRILENKEKCYSLKDKYK